jgi:hypothetical protein
MKLVISACVVVAVAASASAQDIDPSQAPHLDVIHTKEGSVWKGVIIDQVPNDRYRIMLVGGSIVVVRADDVERIVKESNQPAAVSAPAAREREHVEAAPRGESAGGLPFRLAVTPGFAYFPDAVDDSVFLDVALELSAERRWGNFGARPGLRFEFIHIPGEYDNIAVLHAGGQLSFVGHRGSLAPFATVGVGLDAIDVEADGALHLGTGAELQLGSSFGFQAALTYHHGLGFNDRAFGYAVSYLALGFGVIGYL